MRLRFTLISIFTLIALGVTLASAAPFQRHKFDRSRFDRAGTTPTPPPAPVVVEPEAPAAEPTGGSSWQGGSEPSGGSSWKTGAEPTGSQDSSTWKNTRDTSTNHPTAIFSENSSFSGGPPPPKYWPGATAEEIAAFNAPLWDEVPGKWFKKAKQFEELQALQKKTGACLIIYFKNPTIPNQKGLCNWFEKTVTKNMKWRKAMRHYIKLEVTLPGTKATRAMQEEFHANSTPNITILHPGASRGARLNLFEYKAGSRPKPIEAEPVLQQLKEASTPAYGAIFQ